MDLSALAIYFIFILNVKCVEGSRQPNVCVKTVSGNETIVVSYILREKYKTLTWCMGFPPRCSKWRTQYKVAHKTETHPAEQIVLECCDGYQVSQRNDEITRGTDPSPHEQTLKCTRICEAALGMQSGVIPNSALSASSTYDDLNYAAKHARLRSEEGGGAWCPRTRISDDTYEWLQIDLPDLYTVTAVATQGRYSYGTGQEFASTYKLQYQRLDMEMWHRYMDSDGGELINANTDTYSVVVNILQPPIVTRRVRVVPHSDTPRTVCMRVELYGCQYTAGIMSYDMLQGNMYNDSTSFEDLAYDGQHTNNQLTGGLGQLVDGIESFSSMVKDENTTDNNRNVWVGWHKLRPDVTAVDSPPIEIFFQFDRLRSFTGIYMYVHHIIGYNASNEALAFSKAEISFSIGGSFFQNDPIVFLTMSNPQLEGPHYVFIPIQPHRIGQFVKLRLSFQSEWLLISEIVFNSELISGEERDTLCDLPNVCDCHPCLHQHCLPVAGILVEPEVLVPDIKGTICKTNITHGRNYMASRVTSERTEEMRWCLAVPPRCKAYKTVYKVAYTVEYREVTDTVVGCCSGYERHNNMCCPHCKDCEDGLCVATGVCLSNVL